jgi:hypothetical protein
MTFRLRFILLAVFNCLLMLGLFYFFTQNNINLSERLIDMDLSQMNERYAFLAFVGGLIVGFGVNFFLLSSRKTEVGYDELRIIVNTLKSIMKH